MTSAPASPRSDPAGPPEMRPIFVIGYPRSGTTLFRRMLNLSASIIVPPESSIFQWIPPRFRRGLRDSADIDRLVREAPEHFDLFFDMGGFAMAARARAPLPLRDVFPLLHRFARLGADRSAADKAGARWGHKEPHEWPFVGGWRRWYPQAQFLHIVRRPHDVIASVQHYMEKGVQLHRIRPTPAVSAWHWRTSCRSVAAEGRRLGPTRYLAFTYESLVADPESHLSDVCRFLGVPLADVPGMLAFHEEKIDPKLADKGEHMEQTRRAVNPASLGRGARSLPESTLRDIDHICRAELAAYGYPPAASGRVSALRGVGLDMMCIVLDAIWGVIRAWRRLRGSL